MKKGLCAFSLIMVVFMVAGCWDDSSSSKKDDSVNFRMLDTHNTYMAALDTETTGHIDDRLPSAKARIASRIDQESAAAGRPLSPSARELLIKGILEDYRRNHHRSLVTHMGPALGGVCTEFHETSGASDEKFRSSSLESGELLEIQNAVADRFQNRVTSLPGMDLYDEALDQVLDKWFPGFAALDAEHSDSPAETVFSAAEDSDAFNKKMKAWFANYDAENDYGESDGTPVPGHFLYNKFIVTNTFDGKILRTHEPYYEGKTLRIRNGEKTIHFPDIAGLSPNDADNTFIAASADMEGNGSRHLIVFKEYGKSSWYAFSLGNGPDYGLTRIDEIPAFFRVTDLAAGDIDADGSEELMVAGRLDEDGKSGVFVFDDENHAFHQITEITCDGSGDLILRVGCGDTNANGYEEIGVVCYPDADLDGRNVKLLEYDRIKKTFDTLASAKLPAKTPADLVFADLESVDKIDMYVVQLDPNQTDTAMGWSQPDQSGGSDDECRFYRESVNRLNIYAFPYDFSTEKYGSSHGGVAVVNRTYDRQFNTGTGDDGVKCFMGGCSCDKDFEAQSYYLFRTDCPIYATPFRVAPDKPAKLDIDGLSVTYRSGNIQTVDVAKTYYTNKQTHTHSGKKYEYVPVYSNQDGIDVVTMTQGNHAYAHDKYPRMIPAASNTNGDELETVYRATHSYGIEKVSINCPSWKTPPCFAYKFSGRIKRLAAYANDAVIMAFDHHCVLYSDPQVLYVIGAPPPLGEWTKILYETGSCTGTERRDQTGNATIWGLSVSIGEEIGGPGGEGVVQEFSGGVEFGSVQCSGNIEVKATEECLMVTESVDSGEDDIVGFKAFITDSYVYKIIRDRSNAANEGKYISVEIPRGEKSRQKRIAYRDQMFAENLYENLSKQGQTPDIDIRGLLTHDPNNISSYLTEDNIRDFFDHPENYLPADYLYSPFWHMDRSALVPSDGEEGLKYSKSITQGTGDFEHDQYEVSAKVMAKFKAGFIAHGFIEAEAKIGHEWSFDHENLNTETAETSYEFQTKGNGTTPKYNRVGIYSFAAVPAGTTTSGDSKPINRKMAEDFDELEEYLETMPVLVIDYWLTDNDNIENP